jgi:hypothetical protein
MEVVSLLLFVGALWGLTAIGLFAWNLLNAQPDHADRLAILPLEDGWTGQRARAGDGHHGALPARGSARSDNPRNPEP